MQTAVLSGGNANAHYSGLPLRGCYRRLDFELVACCCVILLLAPSVIILVYDYYKVGDSLYKTPFLGPGECRNISAGPVSIIQTPQEIPIAKGSNLTFTCRANAPAYWQWFKDDEVYMQYTALRKASNNLTFYNISEVHTGAYQCMSFLADPLCDISEHFNLRVLTLSEQTID
ncbi:uncharacterized protein LOC134842152 [Symsagittifera roscoffensis]|uniref:uncharacterized protein LOC134842152 n=1 Tax=Symsagittifera roscoffensis TaxID=84072 RepID=UPI00307BBCA3